MTGYLLANPPPVTFFGRLVIGLVVAAALIVAFLRRPTPGTARRTFRFAVLALFGGPLVGVTVAVLVVLFGDVHPLGRASLVQSFTIIGTIAGMIVSAMILILNSLVPTFTDGRQEAQRRTDELEENPEIAITREELWKRVDESDG